MGGVAMPCALNSDCTAPLVCSNGTCHAQCNEDRDCPADARCVQNVCDDPRNGDSGTPVPTVDASVDAKVGSPEGGTDASADALPACTDQLWTVVSAGGTATVTTAGFQLTANASPSRLAVSQAGLNGDFTLEVDFRGYSSAAAFEVNVSGSAGSLSGSIFPTDVIALYLAMGGGATTKSAHVQATAGTITVTRSGSTAIVTVSAGGMSATESGEIGSNAVGVNFTVDGAVAGASPNTVDVTAVKATGNTGSFQSDAFTCDSCCR
jgi:hypothetical protein